MYSGLNGVKMNTKSVKSGYFVTYVSTSWRKEVSEAFMGDGDGAIIRFDKDYKGDDCIACCDVSWISKFPDECEILFARSVKQGWDNNFACSIVDETDGVQTISLTRY